MLFSSYKTQLQIQTLSQFFFSCPRALVWLKNAGGGGAPAAATETTVQVEARDALGQKNKNNTKQRAHRIRNRRFCFNFHVPVLLLLFNMSFNLYRVNGYIQLQRSFYGIQLRDSDRSLDREIIRKFVRRPIIHVVTDNIKILRVLYSNI